MVRWNATDDYVVQKHWVIRPASPEIKPEFLLLPSYAETAHRSSDKKSTDKKPTFGYRSVVMMERAAST
jgi:hypothetical protein